MYSYFYMHTQANIYKYTEEHIATHTQVYMHPQVYTYMCTHAHKIHWKTELLENIRPLAKH